MAKTIDERRGAHRPRAEQGERSVLRELLLRQEVLRCPQCKQAWLVSIARVGDSHICKECGHSFAVERSGIVF